MKYYEKLIVSKDDVKFVNKVMQIEDDMDERWEEFEDLRDCGDIESYFVAFKNDYSVSISINAGDSNFYINASLFDEDGNEVHTPDYCGEFLGVYKFEDDEGNTYEVEIEEA